MFTEVSIEREEKQKIIMAENNTYIRHKIKNNKENDNTYWKEFNRRMQRFKNDGYEWNNDWQDYCDFISDEYGK